MVKEILFIIIIIIIRTFIFLTLYHLVATLLASKEGNSASTDHFSVEANCNKTVYVHRT
jgi:hypothetical protein